jgi:hypothetical protein
MLYLNKLECLSVIGFSPHESNDFEEAEHWTSMKKLVMEKHSSCPTCIHNFNERSQYSKKVCSV